MKLQATGSFDMQNWDEKAYREVEGLPKLARASVKNVLSGDIEGEGTLEYLFVYTAAICYFTGMQQVVGRIGDRVGSFVLQESGTFEDGTAKGSWSVVPGSGTGALRGLRGSGSYTAVGKQTPSFTLDYEID